MYAAATLSTQNAGSCVRFLDINSTDPSPPRLLLLIPLGELDSLPTLMPQSLDVCTTISFFLMLRKKTISLAQQVATPHETLIGWKTGISSSRRGRAEMAMIADIDQKIVHLDDQIKSSPRSYWLQTGCIPARSQWYWGGKHQGHFGDLPLPSLFFLTVLSVRRESGRGLDATMEGLPRRCLVYAG